MKNLQIKMRKSIDIKMSNYKKNSNKTENHTFFVKMNIIIT